jgi:hypothetical protein
MRFGAVSLRVLSIRAPARHVPCTTVWRSVLTLFARLGRSIEEQPWSHEPADARLSHCGRVRGPDCEGEVWTGKLEWLGETRRTIKDAVMAAAKQRPGDDGYERGGRLAGRLPDPPERERGLGPDQSRGTHGRSLWGGAPPGEEEVGDHSYLLRVPTQDVPVSARQSFHVQSCHGLWGECNE